MFKRSFRSQHRVEKGPAKLKKSAKDSAKLAKLQRSFEEGAPPAVGSTLTPSIVTLVVGREGRVFAAHEEVLALSPYFAAAIKDTYPDASAKRIDLPYEDAEVLSAVLEYLYKGDYQPRLFHDKQRGSWDVERHLATPPMTPMGSPVVPSVGSPASSPKVPHTGSSKGRATLTPRLENQGGHESTIFISSVGQHILKDTAIYCAAEKYGLDELKAIALQKQGLCSGIDVSTILASARYTYDHTPDTDSLLRSYYLALIIRCRPIFTKSRTMQHEMEKGGPIFFDLFVALSNHLEDIITMGNASVPATI